MGYTMKKNRIYLLLIINLFFSLNILTSQKIELEIIKEFPMIIQNFDFIEKNKIILQIYGESGFFSHNPDKIEIYDIYNQKAIKEIKCNFKFPTNIEYLNDKILYLENLGPKHGILNYIDISNCTNINLTEKIKSQVINKYFWYDKDNKEIIYDNYILHMDYIYDRAEINIVNLQSNRVRRLYDNALIIDYNYETLLFVKNENNNVKLYMKNNKSVKEMEIKNFPYINERDIKIVGRLKDAINNFVYLFRDNFLIYTQMPNESIFDKLFLFNIKTKEVMEINFKGKIRIQNIKYNFESDMLAILYVSNDKWKYLLAKLTL